MTLLDLAKGGAIDLEGDRSRKTTAAPDRPKRCVSPWDSLTARNRRCIWVGRWPAVSRDQIRSPRWAAENLTHIQCTHTDRRIGCQLGYPWRTLGGTQGGRNSRNMLHSQRPGVSFLPPVRCLASQPQPL